MVVLNVSNVENESRSLLSSLECVKAEILMKRGDVDGAKAHYQKALKLDSGAASAVVALADSSSPNEMAQLLKHVDNQVGDIYTDIVEGGSVGSSGILSAAKGFYHSMKYEECVHVCRQYQKLSLSNLR